MSENASAPPPEPPKPWQPPARSAKFPWLLVALPVVVILAIVAVRMAQRMGGYKTQANSLMCRSHLNGLTLLVNLYAIDHGDRYPASWADLASYCSSPGCARGLFCPSVPSPGLENHPFAVAAKESSYRLVANSGTPGPGKAATIIAFCPHHGNVSLSTGGVVSWLELQMYPEAVAMAKSLGLEAPRP